MRIEEIERHLNERGLFPDNIYEHNGCIEIEIFKGDWKHEHIRCDLLMGNIGYTQKKNILIDEDGSDCYSAIHIYEKN